MENQISFRIAGGAISIPSEMMDAIPEDEKKRLDKLTGTVEFDIQNLKLIHLGYLFRQKKVSSWAIQKNTLMMVVK